MIRPKQAGRKPRLTGQQALEIRAVFEQRKALPSNKQLCRKYGLCQASLSLIGSGRIYKWVR